jgi:CubicO group peptidase (beta-lactamase class C family)
MVHKSSIIVLAFISFLQATAQQKIIINDNRIDQFIENEMSKWKMPGCAIAIVKGKELLYVKGYGFRDVEKKLPVTPYTIFKIASCTKSFTAAAAGLLVQQKLLEWDKPVKEYLPELELVNKELTSQVTLRDLLSHRTGLYDDDWSWVGDHIDKKRMFEILSAMPQQAPLRTSYIYSNMAYALAGELVALKSNSSWRNLISKNFFEPLSFRNTTFSHTEHSGFGDFAYGYEYADSSKSYVRGNLSEHYTDSLSVCEAFGFISSSATDMSKWVRLFINGGNWQGKQIIPANIFEELTRPITYTHPSAYPEVSDGFYCMGWIQNYYKGHQLIQHSGGLSGFKSYMSFMPQDSIGIVVLTNGQPYLFPLAITYDIYDMLLGLPRTLWANRFLPQKDTAISTEKSETNIPGTHPSKPLPEYAGTYYSKWLGNMKVYCENGELYFQFHNYPKEKMKHAHYDTFFTEMERKPGTGITFQLDHDGKIKSMLLNEFLFDKIH